MSGTTPFLPMLATLGRVLPAGDGLYYEPKWDGFRCLAFVDEDGVDLRSRHGRPLARYFPEVAGPLASLPPGTIVDGELVVPAGDRLDFTALLQRLHPAASRVQPLSRATPAAFIAFDLVVVVGTDLTKRGFGERSEERRVGREC